MDDLGNELMPPDVATEEDGDGPDAATDDDGEGPDVATEEDGDGALAADARIWLGACAAADDCLPPPSTSVEECSDG